MASPQHYCSVAQHLALRLWPCLGKGRSVTHPSLLLYLSIVSDLSDLITWCGAALSVRQGRQVN